MNKFEVKVVLVSAILGLFLGAISVLFCLNKNKTILNELQMDYHELVETAKDDQNGYFYTDKDKYIIEIFPIGYTDFDLSSEVSGIPENVRLSKISWYNKTRTKISHYYYNEIVY